MSQNKETIFEVLQNNIGLITLNRPKALNAINLSMVIALQQQLKQWKQDNAIKAIIIKSNHERAFCAGGDIKSIYEQKLATGQPNADFFWHEYRLNYYIANYPKPYIALMDGITMGGGAGISVHGNYRIATENTLFAMPETSIGFFTDIGASYFLSRCPGQIGVYLALTGARIQAADTQYLGLTNYCIQRSQIDELIRALINTTKQMPIADIIKSFNIDTSAPTLADYRSLIDECFRFNSVEEIIDALKNHSDNWCQQTAELILSKSPTSLKIILEQLRRGAKMDLADCLKMEYRIVNRILQARDFYEGVRAVIIDKDNKPQWQPADLSSVSVDEVNSYFAELDKKEELNFA